MGVHTLYAMAQEGNYLDITVESEQYSDLADALERWGRAYFLDRLHNCDRDMDGHYSVTVDNWSRGPRININHTDDNSLPSVDGKWVDIAIHAGYVPHGVIQRNISNYTFMWYLRPIDDMNEMTDSAASRQEQIDDTLEKYDHDPFTEYVRDVVSEAEEFAASLNDYSDVPDKTYDCRVTADEFFGDEIEALVEDDGISVDFAVCRDDGLHIELTDDR